MKIQLLFCLLLLPMIQNVYGDDPKTFEEFKKLPKSERLALLDKSDGHSDYQILQWAERIYLGEDGWRLKRLDTIASEHGFDQTSDLFTSYHHLREAYLEQQVTAKRQSAASQAERSDIDTQYRKDMAAAASICPDIAPSIAAIVPSAESKALNKRARELVEQWDAKWPAGGGWVVTPADMAMLDKAMADFSKRLKAIRKLSPEELQKKIDAWPDNGLSDANPTPHS